MIMRIIQQPLISGTENGVWFLIKQRPEVVIARV